MGAVRARRSRGRAATGACSVRVVAGGWPAVLAAAAWRAGGSGRASGWGTGSSSHVVRYQLTRSAAAARGMQTGRAAPGPNPDGSRPQRPPQRLACTCCCLSRVGQSGEVRTSWQARGGTLLQRG